MDDTKYVPERVGRQYERVRAAMERGLHDDPRFRGLVDSCVSMARHEYGPVDPEYADRAAYEHATFAAAMLLARVYDEDGELAAMRAERDYWRDMAEKWSVRTMPSIIIPAGSVSNRPARLDTDIAETG